MSDWELLIDNIDKIHTTKMGIDRIKRNLKLNTDDVDNVRLTVNAYSYTIITAHTMK